MAEIGKIDRHKIMSAIHSQDTKPELIVRRYLFAHGFRYRLNSKRLPGKPDIVLRKYRTVILVNGCFWHGHDCEEFRPPHTNVSFWENKIRRNKERDIEVRHKLGAMGWHVITIWECQLKKSVREQTLNSLVYTLNHIFLSDISYSPYPVLSEESDLEMAAEPGPHEP